MALGATVREHRTATSATEAVTLTLLGAAIGFAGAYLSAPLLRRLLFGVAPTDWVAFAVTLVGLIAVTAAATWMPARRAARMDPLRALRSE